VGGYGTEELEVPSGSGDVGARDGRVESDGEPKVLPGRPLDVEQWHAGVQGRGRSWARGDRSTYVRSGVPRLITDDDLHRSEGVVRSNWVTMSPYHQKYPYPEPK